MTKLFFNAIIVIIYEHIVVARDNKVFIRTITKKVKDKTYKTILLQKSYRNKNNQPRNKTIANLTDWNEELLQNFQKLLDGAQILEPDMLSKIMRTSQGKSYGILKTVNDLAIRLGINKAIGDKRMCFLSNIMIAAFLSSGKFSKNYIANDWIKFQAVEQVFGKQLYWNEDHLYNALEWFDKHQKKIEKKLFFQKHGKSSAGRIMFLYDVTGSYVEGSEIDLTDFGYQRDGKPGKKQIVIGMMTDSEGDPVCIEVFQGNTLDYKTVSSQLNKIKKDYCVEKIVFVGDRGMVKSAQIKEIEENEKWYYITAITKPQIEKLLKDNTIEYSLFDEKLCEVNLSTEANEKSEVIDKDKKNIRYILKKNPFRAEEIKKNFNDKIIRLEKLIAQKNKYLTEHKKASVEVAQKQIEEYCRKRKLKNLINIILENKTFAYSKNENEINEYFKLSGCYVIKTNVPKEDLSKEKIHSGYKNLAKVEHAFRTLKTTLINIRPLHVRLESHIRGHVFCCMLALKIGLYIEKKISEQNMKFQYCLDALQNIYTINYIMENKTICCLPDKYEPDTEKILSILDLKWGKAL